ncbi:hypothetical protein [Nocardioides pacificus]
MEGLDELSSVELDDDELTLLTYGLRDWGGPAYCHEALAIAMGFSGCSDLERQVERLIAAVELGGPLSRLDWTRVLFSAEIVFVSNIVGTGSGWGTIHGGDDARWIDALRRAQEKVPHSHELLCSVSDEELDAGLD